MSFISYDKNPDEKRVTPSLVTMDKLSSLVRPLKLVFSKTAARLTSLFTRRYQGPDFRRIVETASVDSLPGISFRRHTEQILNAGWTLKSRNPKASRYIQDRFYEIGQRAGMPFEHILQQMVYDAVRFYNVIVYPTRRSRNHTGN